MKRLSALAAIALGAAGCSGGHLTEAHGRSYRAFLERQRAAETPPYREAEKGLDAQEAAIVANSYRQSLVPKAVRQRDEPQVLIVEQPAGYQAPRPLPPSVPKE